MFIAFYCVMLVLLMLYLDYSSHNYDKKTNYFAAMNDKVAMLKSAHSPKIILIGGSNVAFGINSDLLNQAFNRPVVNLAMHAGIGLNFLFNITLEHLNPNDIVVVVPEYEHYQGDLIYGDLALLDTIYFYPAGVKYLMECRQIVATLEPNLGRAKNVREHYIKYLFGKGATAIEVSDIYHRNAFNGYGDVISHLNKAKTDFVCAGMGHVFNDSAFTAIEKFKYKVVKKGAKFILLYPCIPESRYIKIQAPLEILAQKMADHKLITKTLPFKYVFPDNYFFDTQYHLNSVGRNERTYKVIEDIQGIIY